MFRKIPPLFLIGLCLLCSACAGEAFKPCRVSVLNVRLQKGASEHLLGALLDRLSGPDARRSAAAERGVAFVVTLKVDNPNGRGVEVRGLSGVVDAAGGRLGAFRLPEGTRATLPAGGSTVVDIVAEPGPDFLRNALPSLLSRAERRRITATGHVDVVTWLGVRRVAFRKVRIGGGTAS